MGLFVTLSGSALLGLTRYGSPVWPKRAAIMSKQFVIVQGRLADFNTCWITDRRRNQEGETTGASSSSSSLAE